MDNLSRTSKVISTVISVLILLVAVAAVASLFFFTGMKRYVLLGGGAFLILNLYFMRYFFKRNAVSPAQRHRLNKDKLREHTKHNPQD